MRGPLIHYRTKTPLVTVLGTRGFDYPWAQAAVSRPTYLCRNFHRRTSAARPIDRAAVGPLHAAGLLVDGSFIQGNHRNRLASGYRRSLWAAVPMRRAAVSSLHAADRLRSVAGKQKLRAIFSTQVVDL